MAEHPAGVGKLDLWFGVECEGRMRGCATAFVAKQLDAEALARLEAVQHVFLTESFDDWAWLGSVLLPAAEARGAVVTAAVLAEHVPNVLALPFAGRLRLMVRVDVPAFDWFELLRDSDEVSIGVPYHLAVAERRAFIVARPADYEGDVP